MKIAQASADVVARRNHVEQPVVFKIFHDHAAGYLKNIESRFGSHIHEAADAFPRSFCGEFRHQVFGRHSLRVFPQRHICQVQHPFHLEIVGLPIKAFHEKLHGLRDVLRLLVFRIDAARARRENASQAGLAVHVVFHLGFMEVSISENFLHQRHTLGHVGQCYLVRRLPMVDGFAHVTLIGLHKRQGVMNSQQIVRGVIRDVFGLQHRGNALLRQRNCRLMELANRSQVVIPAGWLLQGKKCGVDKWHARRNWCLAAHGATRSEAHRPVTAGGAAGSGGVRTVVRLDHFQNQISCGDLDDAGYFARLQAGQGVSQLGSQIGEGDFSHQAAGVCGGINRFFFGQFAKILAVLQPAKDFLGLALRIHEDQLQRNLRRGRAFRHL